MVLMGPAPQFPMLYLVLELLARSLYAQLGVSRDSAAPAAGAMRYCVLAAIATRLRKLTREPDFLARYGGEEFVLIMPETDRQAAFTVAEKLREAIAEMGFTYRGDPVRITVSLGVTEFAGADSSTSAFQRADQAMYQAKEAGRNRTVLS